MKSKESIERSIERIYRRNLAGAIGYIFGEYIHDYFTNPKKIRKRNHRLALKDFEDMRFY